MQPLPLRAFAAKWAMSTQLQLRFVSTAGHGVGIPPTLCVANSNYLSVRSRRNGISNALTVERCSMNKIQQNSMRALCYGGVFAVMALLISLRGTVLAAPQDQTGQTLFNRNCATCHSQNGAPTAVGKSLNAPDLGSAPVQNQTNAGLQQIISSGKGNMPAFKDKLSQAEIDSVVAYVHALSKRHK